MPKQYKSKALAVAGIMAKRTMKALLSAASDETHGQLH